jgi:hypothetical protein
MVFGAPRNLFPKSELDALKSYIEAGGNILVLMSEGGENK